MRNDGRIGKLTLISYKGSRSEQRETPWKGRGGISLSNVKVFRVFTSKDGAKLGLKLFLVKVPLVFFFPLLYSCL